MTRPATPHDAGWHGTITAPGTTAACKSDPAEGPCIRMLQFRTAAPCNTRHRSILLAFWGRHTIWIQRSSTSDVAPSRVRDFPNVQVPPACVTPAWGRDFVTACLGGLLACDSITCDSIAEIRQTCSSCRLHMQTNTVCTGHTTAISRPIRARGIVHCAYHRK